MSNSRERVFAKVVSIDSWHEVMKFDGKNFSVHVELSFKTDGWAMMIRIFPFTFHEALKRALLTVTLAAPS